MSLNLSVRVTNAMYSIHTDEFQCLHMYESDSRCQHSVDANAPKMRKFNENDTFLTFCNANGLIFSMKTEHIIKVIMQENVQ